LSPRAAWRLESLGFDKVFDYVPGKVDWLAYGLPVEGEQAEFPMVIDRMERDVPTCQLDDSLAEAKRRAEKLGFNLCPVVNKQGIVLGLIREEMWKDDLDVSAESVMQLGPITFRPSYSVDDATEFLSKHDWGSALVTSSDGKLMGILDASYRRRKSRFRNRRFGHERRNWIFALKRGNLAQGFGSVRQAR